MKPWKTSLWSAALASAATAALVVIAALSAACSGDDNSKNAKSPASNSDDPFAAIFGDPKTMAAQELKVQEKVRDCMVAQGFQYTPIDPTASSNVQTIDLNSDDFVKQNGFGISTFVDGFAFTGGPSKITQITDPNSTYLESLSQADKDAYQKALFGELPTKDDSGGQGFRIDANNANGCFGKANKEVRGDRPLNDPGLQDKFKQLQDRIAADARLVAARKDWSACMAKSGYNYPDEDAARAYIQRRTKDVTGKDPGTGIGGGGARGSGIAITSNVRGGAGGGPPAATPTPSYDVSALHSLQDEERKLAIATLDCNKKTVTPVEQKVRVEYEQAFLRDNPQLVSGSK